MMNLICREKYWFINVDGINPKHVEKYMETIKLRLSLPKEDKEKLKIANEFFIPHHGSTQIKIIDYYDDQTKVTQL